MTAYEVTRSSKALVVYQPKQNLRSLIESRVDEAYRRSMEVTKTERRLLSPDTIPASSFSGKLRCMMAEMAKLHRNGALEGEFLVAKDTNVLLDLRGPNVIAAEKGNPQFMIGSVSKQFLAVALLKALYEKAVGRTETEKTADVIRMLHLPLCYFLPKEAAVWSNEMPEWVGQITLHHLLSHTSGLFDYTDSPEYDAMTGTGKKQFETPHSASQILRLVSTRPLNFTPGSSYSYSNTGFLLIAEVIETMTGKEASKYFQKALFDPLKLTSTLSIPKGNSIQLRESDPRCSRLVPELSYDPADDQSLSPSTILHDVSWAHGAGSIISTAGDLLKWNVALHQNRSVLPRPLYELLIRKNLGEYAYGIFRDDDFGGETLLTHHGRIGTYMSALLFLPGHQISVITLTHADVISPRIEQESEKLHEELKDDIPDLAKRSAAVSKILMEKYPDQRQGVGEALGSFYRT